MNKQTKFLTGVIAAVVLVTAGGFSYGYLSSTKKTADSRKAQKEANASKEESTGSGYITYEGRKYKYNTDLSNVLFLGVDKKQEFKEEFAGYAGQSDCIILLAMNKKEKTTTMLQVSRDSMVDVRVYDMAGDYQTTENMQITTQYAYGDGGKRSCQLTKNAVSDLLYEIPIRSYISMNIEGIGVINDAVGGVNLTIPEDYTSIDPAFGQGNNVTLSGAQAERYVRYRDTNVLGSNDQRMKRQTQYIKALFSQMKKAGSSRYDDIWASAKPYTITDMSVDELKALSSYEMDEEILKVPGQTVAGAEHDEYHVDVDALKKMVIDVFYKPVE